MMTRIVACFLVVIGIHRVTSFSGWVDPDTSEEHKTTISNSDGKVYDLVFSDEFNVDGRMFNDGYDPKWTAIERSDDDQTSTGRKSLHFYNASQIRTKGGNLVITTNTEDTKWKGWNPYKKKYETLSRHFKSGMLQSWNKFCHTGGIIEFDVKFPGKHDIGGLWPAVWLLGNLGRATYLASTNLLWPWSYHQCDRKLQKAQEISGCDITSHFSLKPGMGRGATEIDIIEVMAGPDSALPIVKNNVHRPYTSMTLQVAPGIPAAKRRPPVGTLPEWGFNWYHNLSYGANVSINPFFYGTYLAATKAEEPIARSQDESYQADAISSMMTLDQSYFETMHTFRLEWQPGKNGYMHWYVDHQLRFGVEQESLDPYETFIPREPSYLIINTAISNSWGFPNPPWGCTEYDCKNSEAQCGFNPGWCKTLPAEFLVDFIRVYQDKNNSDQTLGCNPKDFPTAKFIKAHEFRYKNDIDVHPLKEIMRGGGSCLANTDCGHGTCFFRRCQCESAWVGPTCLVPDSKNDFPDWELDELPLLSRPYVPGFLAFGGALLIAALLAATVMVVRRRRKDAVDYASVPAGEGAVRNASASAEASGWR